MYAYVVPFDYFQDVTVDMLDYEFLDKCKDTDLIKAIVQKLRSGEEGHYPHLVKVRDYYCLCIWDADTDAYDILYITMCSQTSL